MVILHRKERKKIKDLTELEYKEYNKNSQRRWYYRHKNPFGNIFYVKNELTGDYYVGKTTNQASLRFRQMVNTAKGGRDDKLHRAIRQYGADNFSYKLLYECGPLDNCNELLQRFKNEYKCTLNAS